ncbi:PREDICTED: vascular endothelial growth factor receptor 1 isoform X1 [Trachymyrmex septentrionalis]|uniref:vascular endothelial growth factor receptor 1 isoform X1 n=1 Tax=Trachymyrmex septentrionalis TaxID=34720 RepID=UPI00084F5637|nr:PREDICTED: vascular endothelial growth factor receptor 1 isoform X1 [Trachymyrmex septentrionalis]
MKMLPYRARLRVQALIVLALCQVTASNKPIISPNQDQIVINEGESLEITCTGSTPIKFIYPNEFGESVNTSTPKKTKENDEFNDIYKYVFQRPNTVFGDTGWYGCADRNVEIITNSYKREDPEVNWLYVYVKSNTNLFVEADTYAHLSAVAGGSIVIPCRPTSPDLIPILSDNNEEELKNASFDPRMGFTIRNLLVKDSNWYKCSIEKDGEEHAVNYVLSVHLKQTLPYPKIQDESLLHITRGEDLYVNCTVEVEMSMRYVFDWNTPQQNSSRISTQQFRKHLDGNSVLVTCQLTILNVTDEDAGEYECVIRSIHDIKKITKNITIHDPQMKYIHLIPQHTDKYYQAESGNYVQWVVYVDGWPKAHLAWFKPNSDEIIESPKYFVNTSATATILKIMSLSIIDSGNYTLEAKNDYMIEKLNFTLNVIAKPVSILTRIDSYYPPNESTEFHCEVISNPSPNITWSFLRCPNYPSLENSTIVYPTDMTQSAAYSSSYRFESILKMPLEISGKITCKACNVLACDSVTDNILISDGLGAFGIIGPKEPVTKGDDIELICAASVYNYTDAFTWTVLVNETEELLMETERLHIVRHKTPFTYRSTLKLYRVEESDAQNYFCTGKIMNTMYYEAPETLSDYANYKLIIHDPVPPYFTKTNMNETTIRTIDVMAEGHKTVILQCFTEGMPKPTVTWYKDNVLLKENNQYFFKYDYQELNIKYLRHHDSGKYSCRAISRLGINETYQHITVKNAKWHKLDIILATSIAILGFFLVILAIFFTIKVRREKKMRKELMEAGLMHFEEGALECLNPDLTVDDQAELLPYDKKWEFPRERLKLGKQLGSGEFGVVMKAEAHGICESETVTTVAVKMVRRTTNPTYVRALASELKIMVHLGKHLNVVNLLGACTKNISKRELLVIVEYCRFGNLHNYLLRHRNDFINQIDPKTGKLDLNIGMDILMRTGSVSSNNRIKYAALSFSRSLSANSDTGDVVVHYCPGTNPDSPEINFSPDGCINSNNSSQPGWRSNYCGDYKDQHLKPICTQDLLSYAFQVARGMEYLCQRNVLHGDLAARNILLAEDNIVKICDFGLAKTMYKDGNYKKKGDGPVPIKWMAIESIRDRVFSTQSDIWSFGIVLWEFFTLAETPYPGMEAEKQYQKLIEGYRMEQPDYAIREVYDIMLQCWKAKPTLRPSFTDLVESIGNLLEESVRLHYISLNTPYMDMNTMNLESGKNDYLTMMSAPDHAVLSSPSHDYVNSPFSKSAPDSSYLCMSPGCPTDESGIFSPRPHQEHSHFEFPSPASDSEDAVELSPMLKHSEEDPYLKPINVHERRAEFARQRQAMKDQTVDRPIDRDSGYCNAPRNLHLIDLNDTDVNDAHTDTTDLKKKDYAPSIICMQDNYVNMPKQKNDLRKGVPDSFSNPSYVMISNHEVDQKA